MQRHYQYGPSYSLSSMSSSCTSAPAEELQTEEVYEDEEPLIAEGVQDVVQETGRIGV